MEIDDQETIALKNKSNRFGKLAIASAFLFAILWPLGAFIVWPSLGCISYFAFLYFYYRPRIKTSSRFERQQNFGGNKGVEGILEKVKKVIRIVVISAVAIFFTLFIIGLFIDDPDATSGNPHQEITSDEMNSRAINFYEAKAYDSTLVYCDKVLTTEANNTTALYYKGMVYYDLKKYDDALTWFKKSYDAGLRDAFLSHVLAYLYDEKQNTKQALVHYKEALQMDSTRADIYTRLAELEPSRADTYKKLEQKWRK